MQLSRLGLASVLAVVALAFLANSVHAARLVEDVNLDGRVDVIDVTAVAGAYFSRLGDPRWNPAVDVIPDGKVDVYDVVRIATRFGMCVPVANFTESAHTAYVGLAIAFNPGDSFDPDGAIVLYEWDWDGDGLYDSSTPSPDEVTHAYTEPGTYNVTLRVTDNDGLTGEAVAQKTITLSNVIPEVQLGTILVSVAMLAALLTYVMSRRKKGPPLLET